MTTKFIHKFNIINALMSRRPVLLFSIIIYPLSFLNWACNILSRFYPYNDRLLASYFKSKLRGILLTWINVNPSNYIQFNVWG